MRRLPIHFFGILVLDKKPVEILCVCDLVDELSHGDRHNNGHLISPRVELLLHIVEKTEENSRLYIFSGDDNERVTSIPLKIVRKGAYGVSTVSNRSTTTGTYHG